NLIKNRRPATGDGFPRSPAGGVISPPVAMGGLVGYLLDRRDGADRQAQLDAGLLAGADGHVPADRLGLAVPGDLGLQRVAVVRAGLDRRRVEHADRRGGAGRLAVDGQGRVSGEGNDQGGRVRHGGLLGGRDLFAALRGAAHVAAAVVATAVADAARAAAAVAAAAVAAAAVATAVAAAAPAAA